MIFYGDECKPCRDMIEYFERKNPKIIRYIEFVDISRDTTEGNDANHIEKAMKCGVTRVPTLAVYDDKFLEVKEFIVGDKPIVQNVERIVERYWMTPEE